MASRGQSHCVLHAGGKSDLIERSEDKRTSRAQKIRENDEALACERKETFEGEAELSHCRTVTKSTQVMKREADTSDTTAALEFYQQPSHTSSLQCCKTPL